MMISFEDYMSLPPSDGRKIRIYRIVPWLNFSGALLVVILNALFSVIHSPLDQEISAGESPGFAWILTDKQIKTRFHLVLFPHNGCYHVDGVFGLSAAIGTDIVNQAHVADFRNLRQPGQV